MSIHVGDDDADHLVQRPPARSGSVMKRLPNSPPPSGSDHDHAIAEG